MEKPKKINIDMLAGMMNRSFESLTVHIVEIRKDIGALKADLEAVEQKVSFGNDNRMTRLEEDVRKIKTKLDI